MRVVSWKVLKRLLPVKDEDPHRDPVWSPLQYFFFFWCNGVASLGKPKSIRVDSERDLGCLRHQQCFLAEKSILLEPVPGKSSPDRTCGRGNTWTKGHHDGNSTGTSQDGSTRMSCKSSCPFQCQRRRSGLLTTTTCLGKSTRPGWQILHPRMRSPSDCPS